ncbi:MAG: phosphoribosylformylglycinamidine synthase [Candidatus Fischerbacteria bacterium RBG_13_37_8]|uniref:Phosphoribosylformylglycinamidine synthase n=1 Tax=Candidatus Fischerbacteria bacterium RBG_13_37_8 TaxID=1817863 RepID=A0A1F5VSJ0_9BACT|nr:MAG: phosphoribosylformylglycinamidine synthase [Candidatus Fischerbacteria bacterium RBG_13_37_8]
MEPDPGDIIILVGGKTGRDGIGGATGSSKEHTEDSIYTAGAEVQKGNPPEERKLQRLFRNPEIIKIIKRCNDFGAGGVSVAIGELANGLEIFLDRVPKKYEGLDGTELAISESQERMAVVVAAEHVERFKQMAHEENLEATEIANVTSGNRLKMYWRDTAIVDISRDFIDTHGMRQDAEIKVASPSAAHNFFASLSKYLRTALDAGDIKAAWLENLKDLNTVSQRGLGEQFDSSVGGGTVLMPFGGKYQLTPIEAMAAKIPVLESDTTTATLMSYGFNPHISTWSPFHGAVFAVVEAVTRNVAAGGDYSTIRTTLQEYFEKLGTDKSRWGKPFSALLGAYHALTELEIASIGGKDSMSGSFSNLDVPPTLIAIAVTTADAHHVTSPEFKKSGSTVVYVPLTRDEYELPHFDMLRRNLACITRLIQQGRVISAQTVRNGGIAAALSRMTFGNKIGIQLTGSFSATQLFMPEYGSFLLEVDEISKETLSELFKGVDHCILGHTIGQKVIQFQNIVIPVDEALTAWEKPLEAVFPTKTLEKGPDPVTVVHTQRNMQRPAIKIACPRVLIPVFPGTNCEYETQRAFEREGAVAETFVFRNLTQTDIDESLEALQQKIDQSQIITIPGGFSAGDEPDGSGKFIAAVFRNPRVKDAVMRLLKKRDGLMLGVCNGFQALIKLGLVPYGEISDMDEHSPMLTFNQIGRHMNRMVRTKIVSVLSPWFICHQPGDVHIIPSSHGEGRFIAPAELIQQLLKTGQIATQYIDLNGNPSMDIADNPNGSMNAVEGITSPDGRIFGKMAHTERIAQHVAKNIPGDKVQHLFKSGVAYFT